MAVVQAGSFTGKVALVTGASRGIGAGIVRRLASDGASVAFTFSSFEELSKLLRRRSVRPSYACLSERKNRANWARMKTWKACGLL
jgi:NAD(P)-dependent dehydrogenase (short-subunit alcohol dehydrogenase family)